jgi:transmembrane sensor
VIGLDWELFDRYLAGNLTPEETERFDAWLAERPARLARVAALVRAVEDLAAGLSLEEREAIWAGIVHAPAHPGRRQQVLTYALPSLGLPSAQRSWRPRAARLAAGLLVAAGLTIAGRAWLARGSATPAATERVVTVPRARQLQFRLPDGTTVVLGGGSTLRLPPTFGKPTRSVTLEGEASFSVKHDETRQFRVRARDLIATDLGTEFLVRAYPEQERARVVVRSGQVAVRSAAALDSMVPSLVVGPGQLGRLDSRGEPVVEPADTAAYFAWTRGMLVFDGVPLREALPQLSRWYDLDFRIADSSLGSIPLSGTLDRTLSDDRLKLFAASLGLVHVRSGRLVTLFSSHHTARP